MHSSGKKPRLTRLQLIDKKLRDVEPMLWSIVSTYNGLSKEEKEDIKQNTFIFVWQKIIPKFNPSKGTKLSSFIYKCASNFVKRQVQKLNRKRDVQVVADNGFNERVEEINSETITLARERVIQLEDILKNHRSCLKKREIKVITTIFKHPDITQREIAFKMGYKYPSAVSMMLLRMRQRLEKIKVL